MPRNYKKESEWAKGKYERIEVKIEKDLGLEFKKALKNKGMTVSEFFKNRIKIFLENA